METTQHEAKRLRWVSQSISYHAFTGKTAAASSTVSRSVVRTVFHTPSHTWLFPQQAIETGFSAKIGGYVVDIQETVKLLILWKSCGRCEPKKEGSRAKRRSISSAWEYECSFICYASKRVVAGESLSGRWDGRGREVDRWCYFFPATDH